MRRFFPFILLGISVGLAGCKTNEDPAQGGFFSGLSNLSKGSYAEREQQKQEALENGQDVNTQRQRELQRTQQRQQAVARDRGDAEQRAAALDRDVAALKARLAKAKGENSDLSRQVAALEAQVNQVKADPVTSDAEKTKRLNDLRQRKDEISKQLDMLIGL